MLTNSIANRDPRRKPGEKVECDSGDYEPREHSQSELKLRFDADDDSRSKADGLLLCKRLEISFRTPA